eukprot:scaffold161281_cov19-Tisochrysis_lutea.AAC.1
MPLYEKRRGIEVQRQQRWQRWQTGEGHAREVQRCRGAEVAEVADRRCPCLRSTEVQGCRDAEVAEVADRRGPRMRRAEVWRHFRIRKGIALFAAVRSRKLQPVLKQHFLRCMRSRAQIQAGTFHPNTKMRAKVFCLLPSGMRLHARRDTMQ